MTLVDEEELTCEEKLEAAQQTIKELQDIERKRIEFQSAKELPRSQVLEIWVPAIDALNLFMGINQARRWAIDHNDPWRRLLFDIADDGRIKSCKLEEPAISNRQQDST